MRRFHRILPVILAFVLICGLSGFSALAQEEGTIEYVTIDSAAISGNLIGDSAKQQITVCLPPSYATSDKSYPVVYSFHGFSESINAVLLWYDLEPLMISGASREFILVGVNGRNRYYGSFYANSPVTGNWEDFTVDEVVQYVDSHYRTLAKRDSRGVYGFSMGGYAALNLAFRHPDVYGATYAASPGVLAPDGLREAFQTWDGTFKQAYGAVFAPDVSSAPYAGIPKFDGSDADNEIVKAWESGFGDVQQKVQDYLAKDTPLRAIRIQFGIYDQYGWIPKGCVYLSQLLWENKIPHELIVLNARHEQGPVLALAQFFSDCLVFN